MTPLYPINKLSLLKCGILGDRDEFRIDFPPPLHSVVGSQRHSSLSCVQECCTVLCLWGGPVFFLLLLLFENLPEHSVQTQVVPVIIR